METLPEIKLYGSSACHKTNYYKLVFEETGLPFKFLDVEADKGHAEELRGLYENQELNYPTITVGKKKLRNPSKNDLLKWLHMLNPDKLSIVHDEENRKFILDINGETAKVEYVLRDGTMFLTYSEVPHHLRGQGIGKILVEKTFEKLTVEGHTAVAVCSYIKSVARNSEKWNSIIG